MSEPTDEELFRITLLQSVTDALGGMALALSAQVDAKRFAEHLRLLADEAEHAGHGPSAGLLDELARVVEERQIARH